MPTIPYVKQTWTDGVSFGSAARFNVIEGGINDASMGPAVHVFHNTTQSVTSSTPLTLAFNSERFDQAGGVASTQHDVATNNGRLTVLYAGIYLVGCNISWAAASTGNFRDVIISHSVVGAIAQDTRFPTFNASISVRQSCSTTWSMAVNEFFTCTVNQDTGAGLNILANSEFWMTRVG